MHRALERTSELRLTPILITLLAVGAALPLGVAHAQTTSTLTIRTVDTNLNPVDGFYTVLNQSDSIVATGFTSTSFTLNDGQSYTVQVDNYGSCRFNNWGDTGEPLSHRNVSINGDTTYTAVMYCGETPRGADTVIVNSVDQNGGQIDGYYTTFYQCYVETCTPASNGSTPATFSTVCTDYCSGIYYGISVADYGSCSFSHWQDDVANSDRMRTLVGTGSIYTFTAVYDCAAAAASNITLTAISASTDSKQIFGYNIGLYDQNGNMIGSGFSTVKFSLTPGQTYSMWANSYGNCQFYYWILVPGMGTNTVYNNPVTFTAPSSDDAIQAIYNCT